MGPSGRLKTGFQVQSVLTGPGPVRGKRKTNRNGMKREDLQMIMRLAWRFIKRNGYTKSEALKRA